MTSTRIWAFASVFVIAIVLVLGWLLGVSPLLVQAGRSDTMRLDVEAQNLQHEATLVSLRADNERLDEILAELSDLRADIPDGADLDVLSDFISASAAQTGVILASVTYSEPVPISLAESSSPAGAEGLFLVATSISALGTDDQIATFVGLLQSGERDVIVTGFGWAGGVGTVTASAVVLPTAEIAEAADQEKTPTPTETPAPQAG